MTSSVLLPTQPFVQAGYTFSRRSLLPLKQNSLWQIKTGVVRSVTWFEDGTPATLGLWGPGDVVGRSLSKADPYQIECLTKTEAVLVPAENWHEISEAMIAHIHHTQELLEIVHCRQVEASLMRLLMWLAQRFGREVEQGQLIDLRLTHQEIAELVGATRVTITRIINEFEKQGMIERIKQQFVLPPSQPSFWHYEI